MNDFFARKTHLFPRGQRIFWNSFFPILALVFLAQTALSQGATAKAKAATPSARHKLKVSDPALAQQITAQGGHLIADYGSFQLFDAPDSAATLANDGQMEIHDEYNVVMLNAKHLDTTRSEVKSLRNAVGAFNGKRLHLIHFVGPVQPQWRDELLAAGVQIVSYIPENAYLVYGDSQSLAKVQTLASVAPHVQWEGSYTSDYKIHPKARATDGKGYPRDIGTDLFTIQLMADDAANTNTLQLLDRLKLEPFNPPHASMHYLNVVARLNPRDLDRIALQPEVVSILPYFAPKPLCERQDQIIAGNLSNNVPTGPGYLAWLASKGFTQAQFTASGFSVDVSDTGIDEGTTSPAHFGLHVGGNLAAASREVYARYETTTNETFTSMVGCDGHGTINAHIIAGYDNLSGFPFADTNGYHYGLGVCPFVNVGSSVIFNVENFPETFNNPNYNTLQSQAHHSGARISNNSWGANTGGLYDSDAQNYDALVRDAEPANSPYPTPGNQEMVIVFAAGNSGLDGFESIGSPGSAKNVITVGAADNVQPFGSSDKGGIGDSESSSANEIASFSSRGPCQDGRIKPDIMAPGTHISGGIAQWSQAIPNPAGTGTSDPCFNGSGVDGGPGGSIFFPANQQFYTASSGTSHSAPCVAGGCALVRQYFINNGNTPPSAAMTKAFLLNSARYMTGATANDTLPSGNQGMGEMNLGTAFDGTQRILRDELPADLFTASGQTRSFVGSVADPSKPFRVTVAWTDAPGSTIGAAYNNNLDLTVTVGGNTYKGNVFKGQYSITGGLADTRNNVESVFLPAGISGGFVVKINGTSINSIGVPNSGNALEQDFALVVYNATSAPTPIVANAGTTLASETCSPTNGAVDPGETVTVNFALQNIGSLNTTNVVATLQTNGSIFPSGAQSASYGSLVAGGPAVSQPLTFTANGPCGGSITATLQLQDGAANLGTVNFTIPLGKFVSGVTYSQNFDTAIVPLLPTNWTTSATVGLSNWVTVSNQFDSAPNAAFVTDVISNGVSDLKSSSFAIVSPSAQLSFRQNYNLEASPGYTLSAYDGGVLEISISGGAFFDIIAAGGSFVSGGYTSVISTNYSNPLESRLCWSGNSGGFVSTVVNLPPSAAGQNIVLRWRLATDIGNSTFVTGWSIDSVAVLDGGYACCGSSTDLGISQTNTPNPAIVGSNLVFTATVTNLGPDAAFSITFTDTLPTNVTFVSGSAGTSFNNGVVTCTLNGIPNLGSTNVTVTVMPTSPGPITNVMHIASATPDYNSGNDTSTYVIGANQPPFIVRQPTNTVAYEGSNTMFLVLAGGTAPLGYQWKFNSTTLDGATANVLSLTNLQLSQNGNYSVVVSNIAGMVTSSVVTLSVLTQPKIVTYYSNNVLPGTITALSTSASSIFLYVKTAVGTNYLLQYKNAMTDTNWTSLPPALPGNGGTILLQDTNGHPTRRFYRISSSPNH